MESGIAQQIAALLITFSLASSVLVMVFSNERLVAALSHFRNGVLHAGSDKEDR